MTAYSELQLMHRETRDRVVAVDQPAAVVPSSEILGIAAKLRAAQVCTGDRCFLICPASEPERPGAVVEQVALGLLYLDGPPVLLVHLHRAPTSTAAFTEPLAEAPRTGLHATYLPQNGATASVLTPEFRKMLSDARQEFKYVLVDCPPVRSGPAALLLAPEVDAGIVTIRAGHTRQAEVQSVCNDLRRCGARLMGFVLVSE